MKILFVTDLHGDTGKYDRLFKAAEDFQADVVVNGGDMLPKSGNLFEQYKFITGYLEKHFAQFNSAGIYYLCYLSNDDLGIFDEIFEKTCSKYPFIINLAQRKFDINGIEFIGMNRVVDYPFRLKDRCRMDTKDYVFQKQFGTGKELDDWFTYARTLPTIENELNNLVQPVNMAQSVYVIHMPPYRLGLDKCGHGEEVGSKSVYNFLHEHQPLLSLHGHIHESPEVSGKWHAKLGNTVCVQPGQMASFTYVTIDLHSMQFNRHTE
jgi:Icc-related predicted phosphoesterase